MDLLDASIQAYAWGDSDFIAGLQRRSPSGQPEAELWMGAHPKAPSKLRSDGTTLVDHIVGDPGFALGPDSAFAELPFLKKVLAAAQPLSIQTHPNAAQARAGFERENELGIALDSPVRTYRDPNHKPELICALTRFEAKCGFRSVAATLDLFASIASNKTKPIVDRLAGDQSQAQALADVLLWLLNLESELAGELVDGVVGAIVDMISQADGSHGSWRKEFDWTIKLAELYPGDPGVIVALLLHHFTLEPGQALYLDAGVLHSYVRGAGVEVMANSDNVVRGGLTPKHVDTDELAAIVRTEPHEPKILVADPTTGLFATPVDEFAMSKLSVTSHIQAEVFGPEILLVTEGSLHFSSGEQAFTATSGDPIWVDAGDGSWTAEGSGTVFRTTVPARAIAQT